MTWRVSGKDHWAHNMEPMEAGGKKERLASVGCITLQKLWAEQLIMEGWAA